MIKFTSKRKAALTGALVGSLALSVPIAAKWEGLSLAPYEDPLVPNLWTVCHGETRVEMRVYTKEECDKMLGKGMGEFAEALRKTVGREMPVTVEAAFTSLTYNVGKRALDGTKTLRLLKEGQWKEACDRILLYNKVGNKVVRGLVNRRKDEHQLCLSGL